MDCTITSKEADKAQARITEMKTIGMNLKILENEFIEDNSHCHLCSADMQGPCAFPFRQWMACALALDDSDSNPNLMPNLTHGQCQGSLNRYIECCNDYFTSHPNQGPMLFPWYLWSQRAQVENSPCAVHCPQFNPFLGRAHFLTSSATKKCNECLIKNNRYPWHMFTLWRAQDCLLWKLLHEKIDKADEAFQEAIYKQWYIPNK